MSQAMISSSARLHAERAVLHQDLLKVFSSVVLAPEKSVAGSAQNAYLTHARESCFLVVLLGQESRQAVLDELQAAIDRGNHVAAFALRYEPYATDNRVWVRTPEEEFIRDHELFIKEVNDINQLREEMWGALAHFIEKSVGAFQLQDYSAGYALFAEWLDDVTNRLYLAQKSSLLVLGPRRERADEDRCLHKLTALLERRKGKRARLDLVHIFDYVATREEYESHPELYDLERAKGLVKKYCLAGPRRRHPPIRLVPIDRQKLSISPTLLVDRNAVLASYLGQGGVMMSTIKSAEGVADRIHRALYKNVEDDYDEDAVVEKLRLVYDDPTFGP